ncbi:hypothetical protein M9H77_29614 [Catharanthus roseus]|uniref:Uncharacterized protein n=1 Tax=Catharanthus roseus TaxID=4058 RepID=A0ACB9ZXI1_CATRO|nr:hypothetical protein M9H77_29614 [Catharanthus roseus]
MHTQISANKGTLEFIPKIETFARSHRKRRNKVIYEVTNSSKEEYSSESECESPKMANPMTLKDYTKPKMEGFYPEIDCSIVTAVTFKIEPAYIQMVSSESENNEKNETRAKTMKREPRTKSTSIQQPSFRINTSNATQPIQNNGGLCSTFHLGDAIPTRILEISRGV